MVESRMVRRELWRFERWSRSEEGVKLDRNGGIVRKRCVWKGLGWGWAPILLA